MEFDFDHMMPILSILVTVVIFICGAIATWLKWSFSTSIKLSQTNIETNVKDWLDKTEENIKADIKEIYSDKVNQAEVEKDIERLQSDVKELKKTIESMRK